MFQKPDIQIDLIITDVIMPEMNGKQLIEKVRAIRHSVKVLFMSGYTSNVIAHHGVLEEGIHFIEKPSSGADEHITRCRGSVWRAIFSRA